MFETKTGQVGHLSEQRHAWSVMLLCNYQSSTTRNELMSVQTALKTDQSVHCSDTRPTMLLFLFCALNYIYLRMGLHVALLLVLLWEQDFVVASHNNIGPGLCVSMYQHKLEYV